MDKSATSHAEGILRKQSIRKSFRKLKWKSILKSLSSEKEEEYTFHIEDTEIPSNPCSVSQIIEYIKTDKLKQAYVNLLSLDLHKKSGDSAAGLHNEEMNLDMLLKTLWNKIADIVRSSTLPPVNKELLAQVATIILEDEKKPRMMQGWREAWRAAVKEGVRDTLKKVHMDKHEENTSRLAMHLGRLGKAIEDDLKTVKEELQNSYPLDFKVFETYVCCHHEVIEEHLKSLVEQVTEAKDYYALLIFIIHEWPSDLRTEQGDLKLEQDFLNKIKTAHWDQLLVEFKGSLEKSLNLERDEVWKMNKSPDRTDDGFLTSNFHMDICQTIASSTQNLNKVDENRAKLFVSFSLEELSKFPKRFEEEFKKHTCSLLTSDLLDSSLWVKYHITYINSFLLLKEQVQCYRTSNSAQVKQLEEDVDGVIQRLCQTLMEHFQDDMKPFIKGMMTKNWLHSDEDFLEITFRIEIYSGLCKSMRNPAAQIFINDVHYYVIKEYVSQLMKRKYSCKNRKKEAAADKIRSQWNELRKMFEEMGSSLAWLYPLGFYLSDIIGMEHTKSIKHVLHPLISDYPDISQKQILDLFYFRDQSSNFERKVRDEFKLIKRDIIHEHKFFTNIE